FTDLVDNTPYTFTVCAVNSLGSGPNTPGPSTFVSPPNTLSAIMAGSTIPQDPVPALIYVLNAGLDSMLNYVAGQNVGPTRGSRLLYLWVTTMVGAWNWVSSDSRITGVKDNWNWTNNKVAPSLSSNDCVVWMMCVVDYITPILIPGPYTSIYNCPTGSSVQSLGNWSGWQSAWQAWYNYRQNDGYVAASTAQPTASANWNNTIVVDGTTVTNIAGFPEPDQWTRLTIGGKKQGYLTWTWDNVLSSCLSDVNEATILSTIGPYMATDSTTPSRDNEIDDVLSYSGALTDQQKMWAEFWSGSQPGLTSPPLMFIWLWKEYMRSIVSTGTLTTANIVFSLQDLAVHLFEGARVTWMLKSHFFQDRPIQEIRKRYVGQNVRSWNGTSDGSQWLPYQMSNSVTPAFADFPSGHSHFSKAFALTMTKWFGGAIRKNPVTYDGLPVNCNMFSQDQTGNYGDFVIPAGASHIEPGATPSAPLTISLTTWDDTSATANPGTAISTQAGVSRLYGGIHALSAHLGSQACATEVHGYINSTWNIRTI
ncbi:MAG: hypothetical protein EBX50_17510, partial [Chitinophagia bacterium]|nr:hypothetical protein [Chitinophagia bacterium]